MSAAIPCGGLTLIPGPIGPMGLPGINGLDGISAIADSTAPFTVPAISATASLAVDDSSGFVVGQPVYLQSGGSGYIISLIPDSTHIVLMNVNGPDNAPPGTLLPPGLKLVPGGFQGQPGVLSGVAGGDLTGNYPSPTIAPLAVNDGKVAAANKDGVAGVVSMRTLGTGAQQACAGNDARLSDTRVPSGAAGGSLAGTYPGPTLTLTGVTPGTYGSEALIPQLTVTGEGRVGALVAKQPRYGLLGRLTGVNLNTAATDNNVGIGSSKYIVRRVIVTDASINLTTVTVGLFGAAGGGVPIVCADQGVNTLTAASKFKDLTLALTDAYLTAATLFFRIGTPQGAAATANVWIYGEHLG